MNRRPFRKFPSYVPKTMTEAISSAYSALFEAGGSPQKKTRKMIRRVLPEPPGGWDSPARNAEGEEFTSQAGNVLTWDQVLETYVRGLFFRNSGIPEKFEPAAARIAYTELGEWPEDLEDFRTDRPDKTAPAQFRAILRMLGGSAHVDEYDWDLNGLTYAEMLPRFGRTAAESEKDDTEDTGRLNYEVERIENFDTSRQFARFTDWCICSSKTYWNRYTSRGKYTTYFLLKPGFDELSSARGENWPHDEYSLSMIGLMIGPDGDVEYCCLRRNHEGGMGDHELSEKQISQLLGRPARTVLTYQEPVDENPVPRLAARIKAGESMEEVYGHSYTDVLPNVRCYRAHLNDDAVLVNADTGLPVLDFPVNYAEPVDSVAAYVSYPSGDQDEYGDDICLHALMRPDGRIYGLGHSRTYNDYDYYDTVFDEPVNRVQRLWVPGLYLVELDVGDGPYQVCITLKDGDGINVVTHMHDDIEFYPEDRIMVCDPESEEWNGFGEVGEPEIVRVGDDLVAEKFLSSDNDNAPDRILVYDGGLPAGKVNILFDDGGVGNDQVYLVTGGEKRTLEEGGVTDYGFIDKADGLVYLEMADGDTRTGEETYSVFSLETLEYVKTGLRSRPDENGIYSEQEGRMNVITPKGTLFGEPVRNIEYVGGISISIPYGVRLRGRYFAKVTLDDGSVDFVDMKTGKPLYGRPLHPDSYPYTEKLVVRETPRDGGTGSATRKAIFDLEGNQTSEWFDDFGKTGLYATRGENEHNVIDTETGKMFFDEWLPEAPESLGYTWTEGDNGYLMVKVHRGDGKYGALLYTCPGMDMGYGNKIKDYPRVSDAGIGWHLFVESIDNTRGIVSAQDFPGNYEPADGTPKEEYRPHLVTTLYDVKEGRSTGTWPTALVLLALDHMAQEYCEDTYRKYVTKTAAIAEAIGTCPDWTGYVDRYCEENEARYREAERNAQ